VRNKPFNHVHSLNIIDSLGQRLAAQKGQSDDLVGAMKAQEVQNAAANSDDEDD